MTDMGPRGTFLRQKSKVNQYHLCQCHVAKMDPLLVHMKYACLSKSQSIACGWGDKPMRLWKTEMLLLAAKNTQLALPISI